MHWISEQDSWSPFAHYDHHFNISSIMESKLMCSNIAQGRFCHSLDAKDKHQISFEM